MPNISPEAKLLFSLGEAEVDMATIIATTSTQAIAGITMQEEGVTGVGGQITGETAIEVALPLS